ncbi:MAG: glycogen debranching enzyme N-terminal domain-containing protein, partial [Bacteroidota bacterium]
MSYLEFDKKELVNLEYSLSRETVRTNRRGSFASSTIIGCNTRRYHGLLICPVFENQRHVLLSSLDVTVVQEDWEFELGIHKYPGGLYQPKGHIYVKDFDTEPIPKLTYRIGDAELSREILLVEEEEKILARYTLIQAKRPYKLRLRPFLACREIHNLAKANMDVRSDFEPIKNGIRFQMYENYPSLFMQSSRKIEYVPAPDWHYNIEYPEEQKRGYHYHEDLFVPGFFEIEVKPGDSFVFSVGLRESNPAGLKKLFTAQLKKRIPRDSFENCLINSAQQFLIKNGDHTDLIAGYPWFGQWARDTFIALPGLTLAIGDKSSCKAILDSQDNDTALIANMDTRTNSVFNAADAPLWYCWAV